MALPTLAELLTEWWTGLVGGVGVRVDPRFARRHSGARSPIYKPHLADLGAHVALIDARPGSSEPKFRRVMTTLAVGADGQTDVRVETQDYAQRVETVQ